MWCILISPNPLPKKKKSNKHMLRDYGTMSIHILSTGGMGVYILNTIFHSFILIDSKKNLWNTIQGEKKRNSIGSSMHAFLCTVIIAKQSKILISWVKGPFLNHCLLESESIMISLGSIINHPSSSACKGRQVDIWTCGVLLGRWKGRDSSPFIGDFHHYHSSDICFMILHFSLLFNSQI